MNTTHIISQDVFDKIRSRFSNLEMGDEQGSVTTDPKEARFFDFDFVVENNNLGRVSISINETGSLKIFYSQGILEETDDFVHQLWYDFLREMRMFAKRRLLRFDTRDITKSNLNKDDFQYLASAGSKDNDMNESIKFEGGKKTSYRVLEKTKLIAKHRNSIENEANGARSRKNNIKALYIENSDGERFKYPFIHIAGAKAMQRHVANGGRPYDDMGNAIIKMSETIAQLSEFKRHVRHDGMNQEVNEITDRADQKLESLRKQMEGLCNQGYYESWAGGFVPSNESDDMVMDQATMEDYKSKFTVSSFKEDLAQYFPLLHSIMKETSTVDLDDYVNEGEDSDDEYCDSCDRPVEKCACDEQKESINFKTFEQWVDSVVEGRLEPDTIMALKDLLESGLVLGADALSAIEALEGIGVHDENLENKLKELLQQEGEGADAKDTVLAWLADPMGGDDLEAAQELGYKEAQPEPTDTDVPQDNAEAPEEVPEEDMVDNDQDAPQQPASPRAIAELVYSMYDNTTGKFPKGKTGVEIHVGKELGEKAAKLAKQLVDHLQPDDHMGEVAYQDNVEMESILALAGVKESGPNKSDVPAHLRKAKGGDDWKVSTKDLEDEKTKSPTSSAGLERRKKELGMKEDTDVILKLAGLAK